MATTIITKYGSGAPAASDVVRGELAVDTENGRLYTETSGGAVIEIGRNPSGNVDVTGTVTADGLTLDGVFSFGTAVDGFVNSPASLYVNFDSDNNSAGEAFVIGSNRTSASGGNEHFRVDASGNVGIGKTAGAIRLDVETSAADNLAAQFKNSHATNSYGIKVLGGDDSGNYSAVFADKDNNTLMYIRGDGNVGIGTASPAFGLSVESDNGSGYAALFRKSSSDPALTIQTTSSVTQIQGLNSALSATNNIAMQVSGGNVGIGSSTADRGKLHVNHIVQSSAGAFSDPHIALSFSSAPTDNDSFAGISYATSDSDNYGWTVGAERTTSGVGDFIFTQHNNSATGTELLRIDSGGNAIFTKSGGAYLQLKDASAVRGAINVTTADGLIFTTGASFTERMAIAANGTISTATPGTNNVRLGADAGAAIASGGIRNTLIGDSAGLALTTGDGNVAVGYEALKNEDGNGTNTAVGTQSLFTQNAGAEAYNTAVGYQAGAAVSIGTNNTLVGGLAGDAVSSGTNNTALGGGALSTAETTSNNTALGYYASLHNTGGANTAVGSLAMHGVSGSNGTNNTAMGYAALYDLTTGHSNTAIGFLAGEDVNSGIQNTFLGTEAGKKITTGNSNTALGYGTMYNGSTGSNNVAVGVVSMHNAAVTGGINTAVGYATLYSLTSGSNNLALGRDAGRTGAPGGQITTSSNNVLIGDSNITAAHIQVDWTIASDERDKTDFAALDLGLDFVKALEPLTYKWDKRSKYGDKNAEDYDLNAQTPDGTHKEDWLDIGFKAQAVEALEIAAGYTKETNTNLVSSHSGDGKQMGLQYSKFVPILVKAIQEQQVLIDSLTARIETLEG